MRHLCVLYKRRDLGIVRSLISFDRIGGLDDLCVFGSHHSTVDDTKGRLTSPTQSRY